MWPAVRSSQSWFRPAHDPVRDRRVPEAVERERQGMRVASARSAWPAGTAAGLPQHVSRGLAGGHREVGHLFVLPRGVRMREVKETLASRAPVDPRLPSPGATVEHGPARSLGAHADHPVVLPAHDRGSRCSRDRSRSTPQLGEAIGGIPGSSQFWWEGSSHAALSTIRFDQELRQDSPSQDRNGRRTHDGERRRGGAARRDVQGSNDDEPHALRDDERADEVDPAHRLAP